MREKIVVERKEGKKSHGPELKLLVFNPEILGWDNNIGRGKM